MTAAGVQIAHEIFMLTFDPIMRIHLIAIGGSVMHSLAIALQKAGHEVSGSDDRIYDPARSRLDAHGLLPPSEGWFPKHIDKDVDLVIVGMHAQAENSEYLKAKSLNISTLSYPSYIKKLSKNKQRIVIAGSYGKTTVTAMIMYVLEKCGKQFDYLVGANIPGFDNNVRLSESAPVILLEGDEYFASKEDPRPKFLVYEAHIGIVTGIEWDHVNVFPSELEYIDAFDEFIASLPKAGAIICHKKDETTCSLAKAYLDDTQQFITFEHLPYRIRNGRYEVKHNRRYHPVSVIGKHNLNNMSAALEVCKLLGVGEKEFLTHIASYSGAHMRLNRVYEGPEMTVFRDFAHAPAKVRASVEAIRELYAKEHVIAVVELHTYSSLSSEYLPYYKNSLDVADSALVYIDPDTVAAKGKSLFDQDEIRAAFQSEEIQLITSSDKLLTQIRAALHPRKHNVVILMSSGSFGGILAEVLQALEGK